MKTKRQVLLWMVALLSIALPVSAIGLGDIRVNARFLTDRMAFELSLTGRQYDDLYEVNYDFLRNVEPYLDEMAYQDEYALDSYYRFLDERNNDIRWILSRTEYARFMALDYFFRPIYALNGFCRLRVYQRYPDRNFFYFRLPVDYMTYNGGHSRAFWHGNSYYERNFAGRYSHPVYGREVHSRPGRMDNGFAPNRRPMGNGSGFHFEPMQNPRQGMNNNRQRMDSNRQGMNNDRRPGMMDNNRPNMNNNRPNMNNGRQNNEGYRPQQNQSRPNNSFQQEKRNDRSSATRPDFNRQQSNRTENQRNEQRQNRTENRSMNNQRQENRPQMQNRRESPQQNRPSSTRESSRSQSSSTNSRFSRGL